MTHSNNVCLYCKSSKIKKALQVNHIYSLFLCKSCGLTFTYPQKQIFKKNEAKYNSLQEKEGYMEMSQQILKRARKYIQVIKKYKSSGKYLDIGCSYGFYLHEAKNAGFNTYGVEIASHAVKYAKSNYKLKVFQGTLQQAKYSSNMFDVITLYDVLEHIPDIKLFLKEVNRVLKKNGLLVIQCPNKESYAFKILQKDWNWLLVPQHLWHFSHNSLQRVLNNAEFTEIHYTTWDSPYDFASNWVTKIGLTIPNAPLYKRLIRKVVYYIFYSVIMVGNISWVYFGKGGAQIIYATKN